MQQKNSQSEARKSLVERTPVKERKKLSVIHEASGTPFQTSILQQARLEAEIAVYWLLSKYAQSLRAVKNSI
ncbi:hypothetical protein [Nitrosopumilus zosterae]|uniref:hypothetical protein n=1 Tax=Nitrosopumilus zosterae TaxID=718286 RepID=UPI00135AF6DE|nr:hypothetical protein [Nitrosopumilus zosterae]